MSRLVVGITTLGRKGACFLPKQLSAAPGRGRLDTVRLRSRFWVLGALSWRLCSGSRCPLGGPSPAPPSVRWRKGGGRKVKGGCGRTQVRTRVPMRSSASYLRKAGRSVRVSRLLKSRARSPAVPPQFQPRLSDECWALQQQLGGSDCLLLPGGVWGPARREQGAAIWSLAAGGARVLGTGPVCRTRGQGQRPAGGRSPWWQRRLPCGLRASGNRGRACVRKARLLGGSEVCPPQVAHIRGIPWGRCGGSIP